MVSTTARGPRPEAEAGALCFENVSLQFPGGTRPAVRDVSFPVERGKFVAVIGPSGCGKSTLLNPAAGLLTDEVSDTVDVFRLAPRTGLLAATGTSLPIPNPDGIAFIAFAV